MEPKYITFILACADAILLLWAFACIFTDYAAEEAQQKARTER